MADTQPPAGALRAHEAAEFCGMSRAAWDRLWKQEQAPRPAEFSTHLQVWGVDELRAWVAYGCPPLEDWRRIWNRLLDRGLWRVGDVVVHPREGDGDAA